jgi:hypothetical protein
MNARLARAQTDGQILSEFDIKEFIVHKFMSGEYDHSSSKKTGVLLMGLKK